MYPRFFSPSYSTESPRKYYKIFHYSHYENLQNIDPTYYGTGVAAYSECRRGKVGRNKSYFYVNDKPESCVQSGSVRYEIYLPCEYKQKIYDRGTDPLNLWDKIEETISEKKLPIIHCRATHFEICEEIENEIFSLNYKGWMNTNSQLPHSIMLFEKISTAKPDGPALVYNWQDMLIESLPEPSTNFVCTAQGFS